MKSRRIGQSRQFEAVALPEPSDTAAPFPAVTVADPPRSGKPSNQSAETPVSIQIPRNVVKSGSRKPDS